MVDAMTIRIDCSILRSREAKTYKERGYIKNERERKILHSQSNHEPTLLIQLQLHQPYNPKKITREQQNEEELQRSK